MTVTTVLRPDDDPGAISLPVDTAPGTDPGVPTRADSEIVFLKLINMSNKS